MSFSIIDYGAIPDTDTSAAIAANIAAFAEAIEDWKSRPTGELLIPSGEFYVGDNTITFDHPGGGTLTCTGRIASAASGKIAVQIGIDDSFSFGIRVTGLRVRRTTVDMDAEGDTSGSVGVELRNLVNGHFEILEAYNFTDNVVCHGYACGESDTGFAYNQVTLGFHHDGKRNLVLKATGTHGFCNENLFLGGSFNHSSSYPNYTDTLNLEIEHHAASPLNNNIFIKPSFEDNDSASQAAIINGTNNVVYHPRMERVEDQANYTITFTSNAFRCELVPGFTLAQTNVVDYGTVNVWRTYEGTRCNADTPASAGYAVWTGMSRVTSNAKIIRGLDSGGVERWSITGTGVGVTAQHWYAENGFRWRTSSGSNNDRGLFVGGGSPETVVTALTGSLYLNTSGGSGTTLYVKESGSSNTGWVAK